MLTGGGGPASRAVAGRHGARLPRLTALVVVVTGVALLLALPVIWGLVELIALVGVVGPLIWAWVAVVAALLVGTIGIGFGLARLRL